MGWYKGLLFGITVFLLSASATAQDAQNDKQITTAEAAVAKAFEYTGFDRLEGYPGDARTSALQVTLAADSTPYVGKRMSGKKIWLVTLPDVPLAAIGRPGGRTTTSTFDVYIDPQSGSLLKLCSQFADSSYMIPGVDPPDTAGPKKIPMPNGDTATFFSMPRGPELGKKDPLLAHWGFGGLPDYPPAPFLDVMRHSCVEMTKCIRLEAVYVLQHTGRGLPAPQWFTWLHGYPKVTRPDPHSDQREAYLLLGRVTSDGRIGDCLDSEQSIWATYVGDLPPGGGRYHQFRWATGRRETVVDDRSALWMSIVPPGELLVTDPAGRRTGLDPAAGKQYNEIPRASYYDESIGDPEGTVVMESRQFHASRPMTGEYKLTVTGTGDGEYHMGGHHYDISDENAVFDISNIPSRAGDVHNYIFSVDRLSASNTYACGAFVGSGDEDQQTNRLLTYANITADSSTFAPDTAGTPLIIVYTRAILPESFTATLNGNNVASLFVPKADHTEAVSLPLREGRNELVLTIEGTTGGFTFTDTDSLIIVVE